jgi:curli biogenesis system outer membrane secretion channel CsgG
MKKMTVRFRLLTAIAVVSLLIPAGLQAQGKIRVAIWDFENHAEQSWWFWNDLGPAARNHIDTAFSENEALSSKFSVIEREKLDMVLKEQGLSTSGALDQQTAAQVGKVLGIKYIITGGIDKFAINTTKGGFGGVGGSYTKAEATINMRLIDTTTAERIVAVSADGDVKKGGGFFKGASLSREDEWGIASEAIEKSAQNLVTLFSTHKALAKLDAGGAMGGSEGKIIKVEAGKAWINMGEMSGIKVGDKFAVISVGEELRDPDTGQVLGADESTVGEGVVVEVKDRFAIMTVTGKVAANNKIRKN